MVRLAAAGALLTAVACLTACGGGKERRDPGRDDTLTMLAATDVDFIDPGHTSFALGIAVAQATQRPLYGYAPDDLSHVVPDLAAGLPAVSAGGRRVTVRLRRGVRFSPPVNREVTSHDVAYALERFLSANVGGPYAAYYGDLVGAPAKPTQGVRPVRGISTPDAHTIAFDLKRPTSAAFIGALTMPATAPVPEEYARPFDARAPSTYDRHVVATGPYMVRNDAQGDAVGYQAGRLIELVRNPNWRRATDRRPAPLDAIRIRTDATDRTIAARQVLAGSHMVLDSTPPPGVLEDLSNHGGAQSVRLPTGGYRFLPINTTIKPFDDLDVRKAVLAVFDREAARRARGGPVTGPLATHFLPPGIPGHREAGAAAGTGLDFLPASRPRGDLALAERYMRRAGYPSGRYTGDERFLAAAGNTATERSVALVVQAQLAKLGFRVRTRFMPDDALFTSWCTVPSRKLLTCGSGLAWLKDFPDPQPMLQP